MQSMDGGGSGVGSWGKVPGLGVGFRTVLGVSDGQAKGHGNGSTGQLAGATERGQRQTWAGCHPPALCTRQQRQPEPGLNGRSAYLKPMHSVSITATNPM
jgi:hypothetical protein